MLDGVLFFPVTPFDRNGDVDLPALAQHIESGVAAGPGGVFAACGTGEFHALSAAEFRTVVETVVAATKGRVQVFAGAGGALPVAKEFVAIAEDAGADGILLLPPYLVGAPAQGLVEYVTQVSEASDLPVIVYHRANGQFTEQSALAVARLPKVVGFKDGVGDLDLTSRIVRTLRIPRRQGIPVLQRPPDRRGLAAGLPEHRRHALFLRDVRIRTRCVSRLLPGARGRRHRAGRLAEPRVLPSAGSAARHHPRVRGRSGEGGRDVHRPRRRLGARAPLVDASAQHRYELEQIVAAGRKVLAQ